MKNAFRLGENEERQREAQERQDLGFECPHVFAKGLDVWAFKAEILALLGFALAFLVLARLLIRNQAAYRCGDG